LLVYLRISVVNIKMNDNIFKSNSQANQDEFVLKVLNYKKNGYFLEIGANHPIVINNTYLLEIVHNWDGLMVEWNQSYESLYQQHRSAKYIIADATKINYEELFKKYNFPHDMDYLQIDLEVEEGTTICTLELLDNTIFKKYTFRVVTFEHDIYKGDHFNTRSKSREIFNKNGYILVFGDVKNRDDNGEWIFEDWYVHSSIENMDYINQIKTDISYESSAIIKLL